MNAESFARAQYIRGKQDEVATLERDLAQKKSDLAEALAAQAAAKSRDTVKVIDDKTTAKADKK